MTATTSTIAGPQRKPYDEEIDVYGITHPGKVRTENQDHFLICALKKQLEIRLTSLPPFHSATGEPERLAFRMMVSDGVGGGVKGEGASRTAVEPFTQYVEHSMRCYYAFGSADARE